MLFLLLGSAPARALGLGSTVALSPDGVGTFPPTFDLDFDAVYLEIRALETLGAAFDGNLFLGANLYVDAVQAPIAGSWNGVVQPGGGLVLTGDPTLLVVSGQCRLGAQAQDRGAFGVYVVPELGFVSDHGVARLYTGGALQISAWFGL